MCLLQFRQRRTRTGLTKATVKPAPSLDSVDISPGVSVLSLFRHLNYRPWYALAEFVDNALQSSLSSAAQLHNADGPTYKCVVNIQYDPAGGGTLWIRDNA